MAKTRKQPMRMRKSKNVIGPLKKDELKKFGYSTSKSAAGRHRALNKSVKKYGALKTFRKLNAVATLNKNRAPSVSKVFLRDREWVNKKYIKPKIKRRIKKGGALHEPPVCSALERKYKIPIESEDMIYCQTAYDNDGNIIENKYATQPEEIQCNQMVLYSLNPVMKAMKDLLENPDRLTGELLLKSKEFFRNATDEEIKAIITKADMIQKLPEELDISALIEKLKDEGTMEKIVEMLKTDKELKKKIIDNVTNKLAKTQTKICKDNDTNQMGGVSDGTIRKLIFIPKLVTKLLGFIICAVVVVAFSPWILACHALDCDRRRQQQRWQQRQQQVRQGAARWKEQQPDWQQYGLWDKQQRADELRRKEQQQQGSSSSSGGATSTARFFQ